MARYGVMVSVKVLALLAIVLSAGVLFAGLLSTVSLLMLVKINKRGQNSKQVSVQYFLSSYTFCYIGDQLTDS